MEQPFRPGNQVLAYHGPLVYEAKVLKYHEVGSSVVDIGEGKNEPVTQNKIPKFLTEVNAYYLHYKGWSPKWDEWVSNERIMEYNDDNLGLSRELRNARKKAIERIDHTSEKQEAKESRAREKERKKRKAETRSSAGPTVAKSPAPPKKKLKPESRGSLDIMMTLRPGIKRYLVDDWELLTKDHKLVDLDSAVPVSVILSEYYQFRRNTIGAGDNENDAVRVSKEAVDGLEVYFDHMLRFALLYRFERLQYSRLLKENPRFIPSQKYGLEHLLRLLVNMPGQVAQTTMNAVAVHTILGETKLLMEYLDDNLSRFSSRYMNASPAYDRLANS